MYSVLTIYFITMSHSRSILSSPQGVGKDRVQAYQNNELFFYTQHCSNKLIQIFRLGMVDVKIIVVSKCEPG